MHSDEAAIQAEFIRGNKAGDETARAARDEFNADRSNLAALATWLGYSTRSIPRGELAAPLVEDISWLIQHHPGSMLTTAVGFHLVAVGFETYSRLRSAWLSVVDRLNDNSLAFTNAAYFFQTQESDRAERLFRRAVALDPTNNLAALALAAIVQRGAMRPSIAGTESTEGQEDSARKAVEILQAAIGALTDRGESSSLLMELTKVAAIANDWSTVERAAQRLLECREQCDLGWMRENAIYYGHTGLGRVALSRGDIEEAKHQLLAAVQMQDGGELSAFGPNMQLAKALLERGERDVVLQFIELYRPFWPSDDDQLDTWKTIIEKGRIPDFGANLYY